MAPRSSTGVRAARLGPAPVDFARARSSFPRVAEPVALPRRRFAAPAENWRMGPARSAAEFDLAAGEHGVGEADLAAGRPGELEVDRAGGELGVVEADRAGPHAEMNISSARISMRVVAYSLVLFPTFASDHRAAFPSF